MNLFNLTPLFLQTINSVGEILAKNRINISSSCTLVVNRGLGASNIINIPSSNNLT